MSKYSGIKHIWQYLKHYKINLIIVIIALIITSISVLTISYGIKYLIDYGLMTSDVMHLQQSIIYFFIIISILAIATGFRYYFITLTGEKMGNDIRRDIYNKILALSPSFYDTEKSGDAISRMTSDVLEIQNVVGSSISYALRNLAMFIGALIMMMTSNFKLFAILICALPFIISPIIIVGKIVKKYSRFVQDEMAKMSNTVGETVQNIKTIQGYCCEIMEQQWFNKLIDNMLRISKYRMKFRALITVLIIFLAFCDVLIVLWIGGSDMLNGTITPGQLSSFIFLGILAATSLGAFAEICGELQKAAGAADRIAEFLLLKPEITDSEASAIDQLPIKEESLLEFRDVSFAYPNSDKIVLSDISFILPQGKITAITGPSGSGKSSIIQLIMRFYNFQSGEILLHNCSTKNFPLHKLRSYFSYVTQDAAIFSHSIYHNLLYANPDASLEEMRHALSLALALDFAEEIGIHTYLGERGSRLSGGQKQRIALARAFLRNAPIILLDESTSALDVYNDKSIHQALRSLRGNKTILIVAHKLSSIIDADQIILLNEGKIKEYGTHSQLMTNNDQYALMYTQCK